MLFFSRGLLSFYILLRVHAKEIGTGLMFLRKLNQCWGLCDGSISGHAWSPRVFSAVLCALFLISHTVCLVFFLSFFLDKSMFCGKHQLQWFTQVFPFLFFTPPSPFFSKSFVLRPLSAEFSFLKNEEGGGEKIKHYIDHSHRLAVSLDIKQLLFRAFSDIYTELFIPTTVGR